jgi:hypothetical protein
MSDLLSGLPELTEDEIDNLVDYTQRISASYDSRVKVKNILMYYKLNLERNPDDPDFIKNYNDDILKIKYLFYYDIALSAQTENGNTLLHTIMFYIYQLQFKKIESLNIVKEKLYEILNLILDLAGNSVVQSAEFIGLNLVGPKYEGDDKISKKFYKGTTPIVCVFLLGINRIESIALKILNLGTPTQFGSVPYLGLDITFGKKNQTLLQFLCELYHEQIKVIRKLLTFSAERLNLKNIDKDGATAFMTACDFLDKDYEESTEEIPSFLVVINDFLTNDNLDGKLFLKHVDTLNRSAFMYFCISVRDMPSKVDDIYFNSIMNNFLTYTASTLKLDVKEKVESDEELEESEVSEDTVYVDGNTPLIYLCQVKNKNIEPYILKMLDIYKPDELDLFYENNQFNQPPISALIEAEKSGLTKVVQKIKELAGEHRITEKNYLCPKQRNRHIQKLFDIGDNPVLTDAENQFLRMNPEIRIQISTRDEALAMIINLLLENSNLLYLNLELGHLNVNITSERGQDVGGVRREFFTLLSQQFEDYINDNNKYKLEDHIATINRNRLIVGLETINTHLDIKKQLLNYVLLILWKTNLGNYRTNVSLRDIVMELSDYKSKLKLDENALERINFNDPTELVDDDLYKYIGAGIFGIMLDKDSSSSSGAGAGAGAPRESQEEKKEEAQVQEEKSGEPTAPTDASTTTYTKSNKITMKEILSNERNKKILLWMYATYFDATKEADKETYIRSFRDNYENYGGSYYFSPDEDGDYAVMDDMDAYKVSNNVEQFIIPSLYLECFNNMRQKDKYGNLMPLEKIPILSLYRVFNKVQILTEDVIEEFIKNNLESYLELTSEEYKPLQDHIISIIRDYSTDISPELLAELREKYPTQDAFLKDLFQYWSGSQVFDRTKKYKITPRRMGPDQTFNSHTCFYDIDVHAAAMKGLSKNDVLLALSSSFGGGMTLAGGKNPRTRTRTRTRTRAGTRKRRNNKTKTKQSNIKKNKKTKRTKITKKTKKTKKNNRN